MLDLFDIMPPWPLALALFGLLLGLCYLACIGLVSKDRATLAEATAASILGISALGFLLLILRWASLPSALLWPMLLAAAAFGAWRRRGLLLPRPTLPGVLEAALVVIVAAAFLLPCFTGGVMMALGDYPEIFFHADTPNRLKHAYEFIQDRGMPFVTKHLGVESQTHFAAPAAASAAALSSGLPAHTAFFATIGAVGFGIVATVALLAAAARPGLPFALGFALILGASPLNAWDSGKLLRNGFGDPELYFNHFPDISIFFGFFLFLLLLYACLDLADRRRIALAVTATISLAAAKTGYFPIAGLLVLSAAVVQAWHGRDWRYLLLPVFLFVVGFAVTKVTGGSVRVHLTLQPLFFFDAFGNRALKHGLDLLLFLLPVAVYVAVAGRSAGMPATARNRLIGLGLTLLALLTFLNLFGNDVVFPDGSSEPNADILQPLKVMPKVLAVAAVLALSVYWNPARRGLNLLVGLWLGVIFVLPLSHRAVQAVGLLLDPEAGHEYVDNRAIAEALAAIPLDGSVIVTNDLRYPANGGWRDRRQMQIPTVFGHQAYAVDTISCQSYADEMLARVYPDANLRVERQRRLAEAVWDPEFEAIAAEEGWTHLLIHKAWPHAAEIPLEKLFESEDYAVYAFR